MTCGSNCRHHRGVSSQVVVQVRDEVGDGAFRRLAHKVDLELLARVANRTARRRPGSSTAPRWTGSSNAPHSAWASSAEPILLMRLLALGMKPSRVGEILKAVYEQQMTTGDEAGRTIAASAADQRRIKSPRHRRR
jgi:hypothetical protein